MAGVFSITLGTSIVGMALLLILKHLELKTGRVLLGSARPAVGRFFNAGLVWLEYILPALLRQALFRAGRALRTWVREVIARGIVFFERILEAVLFTVREKTRAPKGAGEVSAFLREVADHKKKLLKRA
ncbi:hypothetical protein HYS79_03215, partial [Patescibacteria group bacterium]|nr:hypothetical protein [Patescibacteria group bacterium]